jgi:hypothetical protein
LLLLWLTTTTIIIVGLPRATSSPSVGTSGKAAPQRSTSGTPLPHGQSSPVNPAKAAKKAKKAEKKAEKKSKAKPDDATATSDDPAASTTTENRPTKTLLPKSLKQPQLPDDHKEVEDKLRGILAKEWQDILVFKDTYRLARRFHVYDQGKRVIDGASSKWKEHSPLQVFCAVVEVVAARVEVPSRVKAISAACKKVCAADGDSPPDLLIKQLFEKTIGLDSRTAAVFRPVHQGVIMPATFWLKSKTRLLSKDVSSADGWRLLVEFDRLPVDPTAPVPGAVIDVDGRRLAATITHYRKEQSLVSDNVEEKFEIEYRLRFRLDAPLKTVVVRVPLSCLSSICTNVFAL